MKICIFGAGAVGSFLGGELTRVGQDVTLIGRGAHLAAMKQNGVTTLMNGEERHARPFCTDTVAEAGAQDAVIFVVKAHQLADAARQAAALIGPETMIVAAQNGIPWWYCYREGGALENQTLSAIDPAGDIAATLGPERAIGAIINGSCAIERPGVINHTQATRSFTIGEPAGGESARCERLAEAFAETDIDTPVSPDIRRTVWEKIMSNIGASMVCVLTRSPLGLINCDPGCMSVVAAIMRDANAVSRHFGYDFEDMIVERTRPKHAPSPHKPSTLQDLEAGKPMEIDAIVGAVAEIGRLVGQPTPVIDGLYGLLRRLAEESGCYPENGGFALWEPAGPAGG